MDIRNLFRDIFNTTAKTDVAGATALKDTLASISPLADKNEHLKDDLVYGADGILYKVKVDRVSGITPPNENYYESTTIGAEIRALNKWEKVSDLILDPFFDGALSLYVNKALRKGKVSGTLITLHLTEHGKERSLSSIPSEYIPKYFAISRAWGRGDDINYSPIILKNSENTILAFENVDIDIPENINMKVDLNWDY